ncbi:MAG: DUF433 domain-containing protein [Gemmataceae bacterium]|nr:DUF433 domain-containing protein [Gemmataceae bacterium]
MSAPKKATVAFNPVHELPLGLAGIESVRLAYEKMRKEEQEAPLLPLGPGWLTDLSQTPEQLATRIVTDSGAPLVRGTKVPVGAVLELLANGATPDEAARVHNLDTDDIRACLLFASKRAAQP